MPQSVSMKHCDQGVADLAAKALHTCPITALRNVDVCRAAENQLVLSGNVSTFYYKQQAQELVRQAVQDVELELVNDIQVD